MSTREAEPLEQEPIDVRGARGPRSPWAWVPYVIVGLFLVWLVKLLITNPNFEWPVVAQYILGYRILAGVGSTLVLTLLSTLIGLTLGAVLAAGRMSSNPLVKGVASGYIWLFRGTPQLVQLILWFNISLLIPRIEIGFPFMTPFVSLDSNKVVTPFIAAVIGLGLHQAAYQAEIYRGGLLSVDEGQIEAAKTIGMKPARIFFRVRLPQAMRAIIPPTASEIIGMTKGTSLVATIGVGELLFAVQEVYALTFQTIPLLIVASIWYLIMTTVLNIFQARVERYFARGSSRHGPAGRQVTRTTLEQNSEV